MSVEKEINHIKINIKNNVAVLIIDSPQVRVNSLNPKLMFELHHLLEDINSNPNIHGIVLMSGKKDGFIAGADILMLEHCETLEEAIELSRNSQEIFSIIESSHKPVIAVIHGSCLGGGLEIALACQYRIAINHKSTKFALPEVKLGLIPGSGGTQRLPKLIGLSNALDMMLTGKMVSGHTALEIGLVDLLKDLPNHLSQNYCDQIENIAFDITNKIIKGKITIDRSKTFWRALTDYYLQYNWIKNQIFKNAKKAIVAKTQGFYPAPYKILEVVKFGLENDAESAYKYEAIAFGHMLMTEESKGLIHVFRGQTECKKNKFGLTKNTTNLAVIGAGSKGTSITQISLAHSNVTLLAATTAELTKSINRIRANFDSYIKQKRLLITERDELLSKLTSCSNYQEINSPDVILETLPDDFNIKKELILKVEKFISNGSIFIVTSPTIQIASIAAATGFPEKVLGIHYLPPIEKSQVVEIITTGMSSNAAAAVAVNLGLKQGKVVITVKDSPGFYILRILTAAILEAIVLLQEGVEATELETLTKKFGFFVGIISLANEFSWDVITKISRNLKNAFGKRFIDGNQNLLNGLVESKPDISNMHQIINKYRIEPKHLNNPENIQFRIIARLVNEAVFCLEEKVLANPMEGDIGAVFGLGFPPFTGGPFRWIDSIGVDKFVTKLKELQQCHGQRFEAAQTLLDNFKNSKKFHHAK